MTLDEHRIGLGGLLANFQSLEFIIRAFLSWCNYSSETATDMYSYPVGTELPESEWTNYDTLGDLINKYNSEAKKRNLPAIDTALVEIRDALAHGRLSAPSSAPPVRLIKFSKPKNNLVRVTFNVVMTKSWFGIQTEKIKESIEVVYSSLEQLDGGKHKHFRTSNNDA